MKDNKEKETSISTYRGKGQVPNHGCSTSVLRLQDRNQKRDSRCADPDDVNDGHGLAAGVHHGKVISDALRPKHIGRVEALFEREDFVRVERERCGRPRAIGDGSAALMFR